GEFGSGRNPPRVELSEHRQRRLVLFALDHRGLESGDPPLKLRHLLREFPEPAAVVGGREHLVRVEFLQLVDDSRLEVVERERTPLPPPARDSLLLQPSVPPPRLAVSVPRHPQDALELLPPPGVVHVAEEADPPVAAAATALPPLVLVGLVAAHVECPLR